MKTRKVSRVLILAATLSIACVILEKCSVPGQPGVVAPEDVEEVELLNVIWDLIQDRNGNQPAVITHVPLEEGDEVRPAGEPDKVFSVSIPTNLYWITSSLGNNCLTDPSTLVFDDPKTDGVDRVEETQGWPVINGQAVEELPQGIWDGLELIPLPPAPQSPVAEAAALPPSIPQFKDPGRALIVNGWGIGERGQTDFQANVDQMAGVLRPAGFQVTILGPEGAGGTDGVATPESISQNIAEIAAALQPGQAFVLYITGHGFTTEDDQGMLGHVVIGGDNFGFDSRKLAESVSAVRPGVETTVVIEACQSGGFGPALRAVLPARAGQLITATSASLSAYFDLDDDFLKFLATLSKQPIVNEPDGGDTGSEATGALVREVTRNLSDSQRVQELQDQAKARGLPFWLWVFWESHIGSRQYDAAALNHLSEPQIINGIQRDPPPPSQEIRFSFLDGLRDPRICGTGFFPPTPDPASDITIVETVADPSGQFYVRVGLAQSPSVSQEDESFSVLLRAQFEALSRAWIFGSHAGEPEVGEIDPASKKIIPGTEEAVAIEKIENKEVIRFRIDASPGDTVPPSPVDIRVVTFHQKTAEGTITCDSLQVDFRGVE